MAYSRWQEIQVNPDFYHTPLAMRSVSLGDAMRVMKDEGK